MAQDDNDKINPRGASVAMPETIPPPPPPLQQTSELQTTQTTTSTTAVPSPERERPAPVQEA
jgi:hypothetical protein